MIKRCYCLTKNDLIYKDFLKSDRRRGVWVLIERLILCHTLLTSLFVGLLVVRLDGVGLMLLLLLLLMEVLERRRLVAVEQRRRWHGRRWRKSGGRRSGCLVQRDRGLRLAFRLQLQLLLVLRRTARLHPQPGVVDTDAGRGGGCCGGGRVMVIVDDGGGQVPEPILGGQHVGVVVMVMGRRRLLLLLVLLLLLLRRRLRRSAAAHHRVLVTAVHLLVMTMVMMVRVTGRRRRHVRVHERLVSPALAPVARYSHIQLVQRTELVHS